jgi:hypothetical protein
VFVRLFHCFHRIVATRSSPFWGLLSVFTFQYLLFSQSTHAVHVAVINHAGITVIYGDYTFGCFLLRRWGGELGFFGIDPDDVWAYGSWLGIWLMRFFFGLAVVCTYGGREGRVRETLVRYKAVRRSVLIKWVR